VEHTVIIHRRAQRDVEDIIRAARGSATRWAARLTATIATLKTLPERCPLAAEADELGIELRELLFGKRHGTYRILYRIEGQTVHVLRIRHAAQDILRTEDIS
jgi:plasmid stabilization system protein ParE